jgi:GT2 family glycosyltransferase
MGGRILLYDSSDARMTFNDKAESEEYPAYSVIKIGSIQGANMAVRRQVLERIGGFDERLGAGRLFGCEDAEMVTRASLSGERGGYCPGPTVYHHHGRKPGREAMKTGRHYEYGIGAYHAIFLMDRRSRSACFKLWYEHVRYCIRRRRLGKLGTETIGMLYYTLDTVMRRVGLGLSKKS